MNETADHLKNDINTDFISVLGFQADASGTKISTKQIQNAIDHAASLGGGVVYFPAGTFLSGTLHMKDNVILFISSGAILLGSPSDKDYDPIEDLGFKTYSDEETSFFHFSFISMEDVTHVGLIGGGIIDSNRGKRHGPKPIAIKSCVEVTIRDITIRNAPNYAVSLCDCDYVDIDNVTIHNAFADGIDLDGCRFVRIENSHIDSNDDSICLKSSLATGKPIRSTDITVSNCHIGSAANCIKIGTETHGDFQNISISNCTLFPRMFTRRAMSGIALEAVDGSNIDGVVITNITMLLIHSPIFIRSGNRARGHNPPTPGSIKNVIISNINVSEACCPCIIAGLPNIPVKNVMISNIQSNFKFSNDDRYPKEMVDFEVPESETLYPDPRMFEILPAWGVYCRHVENIRLDHITLVLKSVDQRPAVAGDDGLEVEISDLFARFDNNSNDLSCFKNPIFMFRDVSSLYMYQNRLGVVENREKKDKTVAIMENIPTIVKVVGENSRNINIINNFWGLNQNEIK